MIIKGYRIQLRHTGVERLSRPRYRNMTFETKGFNLFLGGRWFLAVREADPKKKDHFLDLGFGRAQLRYRREEKACPWPGTDHYYGICNCPNKGPTHPRYLEVSDG